jgi:hypothetical protein
MQFHHLKTAKSFLLACFGAGYILCSPPFRKPRERMGHPPPLVIDARSKAGPPASIREGQPRPGNRQDFLAIALLLAPN